MRISVIIPTYNERENILVLLDALRESVSKIKHHTFSYVVVDDTSPDGTGAAIAAYQKTYRDVFLISGKKEGLGKALLRGLVYAIRELHAIYSPKWMLIFPMIPVYFQNLLKR